MHLAENMVAAFFRLCERDLHDLFGDALDLDVHLQCSKTVCSTRYFEVHVAQVIFVT